MDAYAAARHGVGVSLFGGAAVRRCCVRIGGFWDTPFIGALLPAFGLDLCAPRLVTTPFIGALLPALWLDLFAARLCSVYKNVGGRLRDNCSCLSGSPLNPDKFFSVYLVVGPVIVNNL